MSALTRVACTMPGSGFMPSTTSTSAPSAGSAGDLDDVLHQRLVVAGGEQLFGRRCRGTDARRRQVGAERDQRRPSGPGFAVGDRLDEGDAEPLAIEGADDAEAGGGQADVAAGRGDENGRGHAHPP